MAGLMSDKPKHTALLITFYWPPSGGPGVHRWLRFAKFFQQNDWKLHVYCPEDAAWPMIDADLQNEVGEETTVIRRKIFEPHKLLGKKNNPNVGGGLTKQGKSSLFQRFVIWTRGNVFIPDARVFWIKPSIRFLRNYLRQHPEIDTLISSGPPHSMHLIARGLKKEFPKLKWVADFRDPWTEIDFYQDLNIGKRADKLQHELEKAVLTEADLVISIGENCALGLEKIGQRKVEIFTNGFIFPKFDPKSIALDDAFTIAHFGSMSFPRNPEVLWKALAEIVAENEAFKNNLQIRLVGPVDYGVFERIDAYQLRSFVQHIPPVAHAESIQLQQKTQVLLLVANKTGNVKGILTGKFFEYLGAKRPVLAIGERESDLENVVQATNCGAFVGYEEITATKDFLLHAFELYQQKHLYVDTKDTEQFDSENIAFKLLDRLGQLH